MELWFFPIQWNGIYKSSLWKWFFGSPELQISSLPLWLFVWFFRRTTDSRMDGLTREAKGKNRFWFAGLLLVLLLLLLLLLLGGGWHGNIKCDPSRTKDRARENWIEKQPLPSLRLLLRLLLVVQVVGWRTPSCRSRLTATFDYYSPPLLYSILF